MGSAPPPTDLGVSSLIFIQISALWLRDDLAQLSVDIHISVVNGVSQILLQ